MVLAMSETEGSVEAELLLAESIVAVCLRVTMLEIGVVKNLEHAPARAPTTNSSTTGNVVALIPFFRSRFERM